MIRGVDVLGIDLLVLRRPSTVTSLSCSGHEPMAAIGTKGLARGQPNMVTFLFCSG
jgi:hypothetical protein